MRDMCFIVDPAEPQWLDVLQETSSQHKRTAARRVRVTSETVTLERESFLFQTLKSYWVSHVRDCLAIGFVAVWTIRWILLTGVVGTIFNIKRLYTLFITCKLQRKAQYHQDQLNLYGGLQLSNFKLLTANLNHPHPDFELGYLTRYISDDDRYLVSSLLFCSSLFSPGRQETGIWSTGDTPNSG